MVGLFLVMGLSGCGQADKANEVKEQTSLGAGGSNVLNQDTAGAEEETTEGEGGLVDKLKNAISSGKKMKCTYKMADGNGETEVITYLQGDKYKTEILIGEMRTMSVFDGEAMYSWVLGQKVGTKMTMDCIDSLDTKGETVADIRGENIPEGEGDEFVETLLDAQNLSCVDADEVDFSIPSDVNFSDQCEMLKSQQKMIEGLNQ